MLNQKSVLARLLANENITVQQGNYETAFFDVESRVLGLPLWKEMNKDVFDMLVGHEVAHALFTPADFTKYLSEGIPHSHLNIVEDVRIEKKVLRKYPGLVGNFKRGYLSLMNDLDLFGVKDKLDQLHTLPFMDRLNLHAKARDLLDIPFADDELPFVAQAKACEEYEDVVQCCRDIQVWLNEKAEEQKEEEGEGSEDNNSTQSEEGKSMTIAVLTDDMPETESEEGELQTVDQVIDLREETSEDQPQESVEDEENSTQESVEGDTGEEAETEEETSEASEESAPQPEAGSSTDEAMTDVNFNSKQSELLDTSDTVYVKGLTKEQSDASTVPYNLIAQGRRDVVERVLKEMKDRGLDDSSYHFKEQDYANFLRETKQVVNLMVKEFEMRKAAYRSARARTSTKGTLDVNKLHRFKYDDHLFKQVQQLADAQSHGMMMLIDYSGSMHRALPAVIRQLLALLMFCKRVGIPFEVYAFTSTGGGDGWKAIEEAKLAVKPTMTNFDSHELGLIELFSSTMPKRDYEEAFKMMFWQANGPYGMARSQYEALGNTPLNAALMAMQYKIKAFRQKHSFQKMNFVSLTDGDSNWFHVNRGDDYTARRSYTRSYSVEINGKIVKMNGRNETATLVKEIGNMGCKTLNYFVCESGREVNGAVRQAVTTNGWNDNYKKETSAAKRDLRQKGCAIFDNNLGYDRRFILRSDDANMQGEIDELTVSSDMTAKKIAKAFGQSNGSKKKSRVITQKFAEIVA